MSHPKPGSDMVIYTLAPGVFRVAVLLRYTSAFTSAESGRTADLFVFFLPGDAAGAPQVVQNVPRDQHAPRAANTWFDDE